MKSLGRLIPKPGYKVYAGADISAIYTLDHKLFWACTATLPNSKIQANVIFVQIEGRETEAIVPLNDNFQPLINARGSLNGFGYPVYVGWDKTNETNPAAYAYLLDEIPLPTFTNTGNINAPIKTDIPAARWIGSEDDHWNVTDELVRTKFRLTDTLVNAMREALLKNGFGK